MGIHISGRSQSDDDEENQTAPDKNFIQLCVIPHYLLAKRAADRELETL
jgi:hypothetical protein